MKVFFYANSCKAEARDAAKRLSHTASRPGLAVVHSPEEAEVIVVLGGDGTILRAVHAFSGVPVLGFNLGGLGYLSSVGASDFESALAMLAEGRFRIAERSMLSAVKRCGNGRTAFALNDIVVMREMSGHTSVLDLEVDGRPATHYMADGIVVATPTGSTAYSLSAGGPVLMSDSASFVVTPMNPHALGIRPTVVSDRVKLSISSCRRVNGVAEKVGVYADGESVFSLDVDETLDICKAPMGAKLVELEGYDPYEVLSRKLGWSGGVVR